LLDHKVQIVGKVQTKIVIVFDGIPQVLDLFHRQVSAALSCGVAVDVLEGIQRHGHEIAALHSCSPLACAPFILLRSGCLPGPDAAGGGRIPPPGAEYAAVVAAVAVAAVAAAGRRAAATWTGSAEAGAPPPVPGCWCSPAAAYPET